ncbi:MAG: hypothetical protein KJN64_00550 [Ignavibacteria bacterium]|nr:hypothetical protein [Ignavibacteria bacterium]MBT8381813.1 hypothetical protein [Ignavibacteria bacterium]MBT8392489.1 hypothetical protein [Ignavibacteria bacterium]NNJ53566.1 hypothetical protein [Ignavibacteriaceae bacterium]NNL22068.1 hypothetical protein [Ignavibacteriaceae bacterium]
MREIAYGLRNHGLKTKIKMKDKGRNTLTGSQLAKWRIPRRVKLLLNPFSLFFGVLHLF